VALSWQAWITAELKIELRNQASVSAAPARMREIPCNYSFFPEREIVCRLLDSAAWGDVQQLLVSRRTGQSARKDSVACPRNCSYQ